MSKTMNLRYDRSRQTARAATVRILLCGLVLAGAWPCWAATQTVTNTNDSGAGSLRDAIATAASGDTIQFSVTGTITLTSGVLIVNNNLTITGPGAAQLAVSGNNASEVFRINNGMTVTISGLTIEKGRATTSYGGGILNFGTLIVSDSTLSGNSAPFGGGGINNFGTLTVTNSTLAGNSAQYGGGIENSFDATLTVTNSTLAGNSATSDGGGINNDGTLTVTNSTLAGNSATSDGGGINNDGTLTVTNSTLSGNSAAYGGGIENSFHGTLTITNSTLAGNSASVSGGGIQNDDTITAKGTLLASNQGGNCGSQTITSAGDNLSDDSSCTFLFGNGTDKNGMPAQLDPKGLQNNGGPTQTIALEPNSPAVDAIPVANCTDTQGNAIATDQRGVKRPQGSGCDIGAFELVQNTPFSYFNAKLAILTGKPSGFGLTAWLALGSGSNGIHPLSEAVTLQIANYGVTIPAGSFHQLWKSPQAPYVYQGTINGTKLLVGLISLGGNNYQFDAAGSPVTWTGVKNPVTVSLTIGDDTGSTPVTALISAR